MIKSVIRMAAVLLLTSVHAMASDMARPWTFWYWMYGAVSREGIRADLQAMKDVGLGGCYLMPIRGVDEKPEFSGTAQQLTPAFWEMVDYAFAQADSLGLELGIHVCDGFALAGGPWITPEESMQHVVWNDTIVTVGKGGEVALPLPAVTDTYYEDIAAFAVPVSPDLPSPKVSGTITADDKGVFRSKEAGYIQYDYDEPQTVRSLHIVPSGNNLQAQRLLVQASDDGITYRNVRQLVPPRQGWQNNSEDYTFSIPTTTTRHFRFCWTPDGTEPGSEDLDAAKWSPVLKVKAITLSCEPRIDQYESKNGSVWRIASEPDLRSYTLDGSYPVRLKVEGSRAWFPEVQSGGGKVRILRFGHTTTGHTNATAGGGKGLECDKFSPVAVGKQIDHWFGEFKKRPHANVVKFMHVDSWECGSQNWSRNFAEEFQKRRGYDVQAYMPVFAGYPMEDDEQVLHDIRTTINELLQECFFQTVAERARQYGVLLSAESVAPTMVSDGMEHYKHVDLPMGEYWLNSPTHDKPNDMLDAISGAHSYGKQIVQAEGFTEVRGVWDETPSDLKTLLDRNLAMGMNRLFFHVFTHNPWTDKRPGMTLDGIGLFFQRDQTWFPEAKGLVEYITRCQRWLQRGWPVVDIAVYTGEEMPRRAWRPEQLITMLPGLIGRERVAAEQKRLANEGLPMVESPVGVKHSVIADPKDWVNPLNGYCFDSMNPDGLKEYWADETSGDHETHPAHRPQYKVLVIPEDILISDSAQTYIEELRQQGMTIIDNPYTEHWIDNLMPDVILPDGTVAFCHRRDGKQDIYFLANQTDSVNSFYATFRRTPRNVMLYDPMTDRYTVPIDDITSIGDSMTVVQLAMKARQSLFVLFDIEGITPEVESKWHRPLVPDMPKTVFEWKQKGGWQLLFRENGVQMKSDTLFSWSDSQEPQVRYYSGHVRYTTTLNYKSANLEGRVMLSLGDVRDVAHVWLNGQDMGIVWTSPYEVDVTGRLQQGKNTLEVEVVNTWHNALRGMDKDTPPYPGIWTNAKYRTKGDDLLPAGLLGPVTLSLDVR